MEKSSSSMYLSNKLSCFSKTAKSLYFVISMQAVMVFSWIIFPGNLIAGNLHEACEEGDLKTVTRLIKAGAIIDTRRNNYFHGETPLHLAVESGHIEIVKLLIKNKADLTLTVGRNAPNCKMSPLHTAANGGHLNIIKLLLENGADPKARNCNNLIPLHFAISQKKSEIAIFLIEKIAFANLNKNDLFLATDYAVRLNNLKLLNYLIDKGVDVNIKTAGKDHHSLLHTAARNSSYQGMKITRQLIALGADLYAKNFEGRQGRRQSEQS